MTPTPPIDTAPPSDASIAPGYPDRLRAAGLRVTAQRVAVLDALALSPHATAERVYDAIRARVPGIALQTVHQVVTDLTRAGLVQRVSLAGASSARYELLEHADNHHHIQCIACGRVEDVPCTLGHAPCLTPAATHGMRVVEASITFRAICSDCEERQNHG